MIDFRPVVPEDITHLSASSIGDYLICPMRWYGSRIGKWPQEPAAAPQIGTAIHRALTAYHRGKDDELELLAAWKECVTVPTPSGSIQRALSALALYRAQIETTDIDDADYWFSLPVDGLPVPIIGAFDLTRVSAQATGGGEAWDWKTGKGTNWRQEKADTELQATVYWWAYTKLAGFEPSRFVYIVIQTESGEPWIKPFTTHRTPEQVAIFEDLCRDVYRRMLNDPVISTCPRNWCRFPEQCGRDS